MIHLKLQIVNDENIITCQNSINSNNNNNNFCYVNCYTITILYYASNKWRTLHQINLLYEIKLIIHKRMLLCKYTHRLKA